MKVNLNWNPKRVNLSNTVDQANVLLPALTGNWSAAAGNLAGNAATTALGLTGPVGAIGGFLLGNVFRGLFGSRRKSAPLVPDTNAVMSSNLAALDAKRQQDLYQIYTIASEMARNMYQSALAQTGNNRQAINASIAQIAPRVAEFLANALSSYYQAEAGRMGQTMQALLTQDEMRLRADLAEKQRQQEQWMLKKQQQNMLIAGLLGLGRNS